MPILRRWQEPDRQSGEPLSEPTLRTHAAEFFCPKTHSAAEKLLTTRETITVFFFKLKNKNAFVKKMKKAAPEKMKKAAPETPTINRRGGARPGAGRKKGGRNAEKKETSKNILFGFKLSKINNDKLKKIADFLGKKPQEILTDFIENFDLKN